MLALRATGEVVSIAKERQQTGRQRHQSPMLVLALYLTEPFGDVAVGNLGTGSQPKWWGFSKCPGVGIDTPVEDPWWGQVDHFLDAARRRSARKLIIKMDDMGH